MRQVGIPSTRPALARAAKLLPLLAALLLSACSPDLDWRELNSAEGNFQVLMPGRPKMVSGPAGGAGGSNATMTMWTAETGNALFGAGYTDYSDEATTHIDASRDGLVRNIRGKIIEDRDTRDGDMILRVIRLEGVAPDGAARVMHARLYASSHRLYQMAIIAKPGALTENDLETFFTSFKRK